MTPSPEPLAPPARLEPTGCCPPFNPATWSTEPIVWRDQPFVTDRVHCLFHIPLDFGQRVARNQRLIDAAGASPVQPLTLSADRSPWSADLFLAVTGPVPGARMARLSGTFHTKVYEGPYGNMRRWMADMERHLGEQNLPLQRLLVAYTTCPRCAKAYGKNYVILFAQVASAPASAAAA